MVSILQNLTLVPYLENNKKGEFFNIFLSKGVFK